MKRYIKSLLIILTAQFFLLACKQYKFPDPTPAPGTPGGTTVTAGTADFTRYVSVGNSLTAGFMDNALYLEGQQNSYPAIMASRMALVTGTGAGGAFNQPLLPAGNGTNGAPIGAGGAGRGRFAVTTTATVTFLAPSTGYLSPDFAFSGDRAALNNLGVPGILLASPNGDPVPHVMNAKMGDATFGATDVTSTFNPFYNRFATVPGTTTVMAQALARNPTFFSLWIGNNDILGYATLGGTVPSTPTTAFNSLYPVVLNSLLGATATPKGVVANIPDVTSIPHFAVVPVTGYPPSPSPTFDATTAAGINIMWGLYITFLNNPATNPSLFAAGNGNSTIPTGYVANPANIPANLATFAPFLANSRSNGIMVVASTTAGTQGTPTSNGVQPSGNQIRMSTAADRMTLTAQGPGAGTLAPATGITGGITPPLTTTAVPGQPNIFPFLDAGTQGLLTASGITQLYFVPNAGPIRSRFVLDVNELQYAGWQVASFNQSIAAAVTAANTTTTRVALWNANGFLATTNQLGYTYSTNTLNTNRLTTAFPLGGLFSLDGVHPTPAGYAVIANEMMKQINTTFGSTLPQVDVSQYRGIIPNY